MLNESNSVTSSVTERFGIRNAKKINPFEATFCSCIVVLSLHDYRRIFLKKIRTFLDPLKSSFSIYRTPANDDFTCLFHDGIKLKL